MAFSAWNRNLTVLCIIPPVPHPQHTPCEHTKEARISEKPLTYLTVEGMGLQEPRNQTQFQVCSHHMEIGEEFCKKATVPTLDLGRLDGTR